MYKSPDMPDMPENMPDKRPNMPREMTDKPPEGVLKPIAVKTEKEIDLGDPTKEVRPPPPSMAQMTAGGSSVMFMPSRMPSGYNMSRSVGTIRKRSLGSDSDSDF